MNASIPGRSACATLTMILAALTALAFPAAAQDAGPGISTQPDRLDPTAGNRPPLPVDDLHHGFGVQVPNATPRFVHVIWTAPTDPDRPGSPVHAYDLRYSRKSPKAFASAREWFGYATPVVDEPLPAVPGTPQLATLHDIYPGTYYFALRSSDGLEWSDLSNIDEAVVNGEVDAVAETVLPASDAEVGGCGLATGGATGFLATFLVALAGMRIHRRS